MNEWKKNAMEIPPRRTPGIFDFTRLAHQQGQLLQCGDNLLIVQTPIPKINYFFKNIPKVVHSGLLCVIHFMNAE